MLLNFTPPDRARFDSDETWGDAYWKARKAFIHAGHSERHDDYCAASDGEKRYAFQIQQMYEGSGDYLSGNSSHELPWFDDVDKAIAYLEQAPFPGSVQRTAAGLKGEPTWLTAGVAYTKWAGEQDYWKARNLTPGLHHWHPELGQTGPGTVPCTLCDVARADAPHTER